jgi:hypothetical protein
LISKLFCIQHRVNPLHVYCRLLERGINKRLSSLLCRTYEVLLFRWINFVLRSVIHYYLAFGGSCGIQEALKGNMCEKIGVKANLK